MAAFLPPLSSPDDALELVAFGEELLPVPVALANAPLGSYILISITIEIPFGTSLPVRWSTSRH